MVVKAWGVAKAWDADAGWDAEGEEAWVGDAEEGEEADNPTIPAETSAANSNHQNFK